MFFNLHYADNDLKERIHKMAERWITKLDLYPETFGPLLEKMIASDELIVTDSQLCSAMSTYGKYAVAGAVLQKRGRKSRDLAVQHLQKGVSRIGVQPTSTSRRRASIHMGRGARRLHAGRPPKASFLHEHVYAGSQCSSSQLPSRVFSLPNRRRMAAPLTFELQCKSEHITW